MLSSEKYKEILKEYEALRNTSQRELEKKREYILMKFPEIEKIEDEINLTSINLVKTIISVPKEERKAFLQNLKNKNDILFEKKRKILTENGFPEDYLEIKFICQYCEDTGYIENKKCDCFKQKIIEKFYDMYLLKEKLKYENFENFNFNLFSKEFDAENKMSPYENIRYTFKSAQRFVKNFNESFDNIVFYGNPGVGKTFLCNCIAKELLEQGKTVIYNTALELFKLIENLKFNKDGAENSKNIEKNLDFITEADLLILDDLGTEFITKLSSSELFNIINLRILQNKSTIISTNLDPESLMNQYSSRVVSRLYGHYQMLKIYGQDIRTLQKFK